MSHGRQHMSHAITLEYTLSNMYINVTQTEVSQSYGNIEKEIVCLLNDQLVLTPRYFLEMGKQHIRYPISTHSFTIQTRPTGTATEYTLLVQFHKSSYFITWGALSCCTYTCNMFAHMFLETWAGLFEHTSLFIFFSSFNMLENSILQRKICCICKVVN